MKNLIFIKYYNLLRQKWSTKQTISWIFSAKNSRSRYADCFFWNLKWKRIFKKYGLKANTSILGSYFEYLNKIYFNSEYPPSVSTIFSKNRIQHFKILYKTSYFNSYLYEATLMKVAKKSLQKSDNDIFELKETIDKSDLYRFKNKNGSLKYILFLYCTPNNLFFQKNNVICLNCEYKNICKIRV